MRKKIKENLLEIFKSLFEAHSVIKNFIDDEKYDNAISLLGECQDTALQLGSVIESSEGEDFVTISLIADYCKSLYEVASDISEYKSDDARIHIDKSLLAAENSAKNDIKVKLEIVFMPYKASMWDSLESVWKAADEDPDCDAYVVPIPYYDRNPDHSFGKFHYEGLDFPDYVPIVHYNKYNLRQRCPDVIYIHNPYDDCNYVTSVDPRYYSRELKKYTDKLVYIPYFVLSEPNPDNPADVESVSHFVTTPGVINSDKVIVQSEAMRQVYIKVLLNCYGDTPENREIIENKISGDGSPKFDKVVSTDKENLDIPDEWLKIIKKPDGSWKKIIFYNTSIAALLENNEKYISKLKNVLEVFYSNRESVTLLWRPHPLLEATLKSMRPELWNAYKEIVDWYIAEGWGIYDDTSDLDRAIALSDAYYGDSSSVAHLLKKVNKPVMYQSVFCDYPEKIALKFENLYDDGDFLWFTEFRMNALFKMDKKTWTPEFVLSFPGEKANGVRLFRNIIGYNDKLIFTPFGAKKIAVYDKTNGMLKQIDIEAYAGEFIDNSDGEWNYASGILVNGSIYYFPHKRKNIIRYDPETDIVEALPHWSECVLKYKPFQIPLLYYNVCVKDGKIYAPVSGANLLEIIDIQTEKIDILEIGAENNTYFDVAFHDNKLYMIPLLGDKIATFNTLKNEQELYSIDQKFSGHFQLYSIHIIDGFIYIVPMQYKEFLVFKITANGIEKTELSAFSSFKYNDEKYANYFSYFEGGTVIDNKLYMYNAVTNEECVYNAECGILRTQKILFDKQEIDRKIKIDLYGVPEFSENEMFDLNQMISGLK